MIRIAMDEKLREAACYGDVESIQKLIAEGVDINNQHKINGWTALHWAAKRQMTNVVKVSVLWNLCLY